MQQQMCYQNISLTLIISVFTNIYINRVFWIVTSSHLLDFTLCSMQDIVCIYFADDMPFKKKKELQQKANASR